MHGYAFVRLLLFLSDDEGGKAVSCAVAKTHDANVNTSVRRRGFGYKGEDERRRSESAEIDS